MAFELTSDRKAILDELLPRYPTKQAVSIPLLHLCQEQNGYINEDVIAYVARTLSLSTAEVQGVVTFYTLYMQKKVGRNVIWVCRTLSCELTGAREITHCLEKKLGIHCGETTKDGEFTLFKAECLAACGQGPMIQLNDRFFENLTPESLDAIIDEARKHRDDKVKAAFSPVGIHSNPGAK
jgi:NADH-quinone oxidoreductase subunit E